MSARRAFAGHGVCAALVIPAAAGTILTAVPAAAQQSEAAVAAPKTCVIIGIKC